MNGANESYFGLLIEKIAMGKDFKGTIRRHCSTKKQTTVSGYTTVDSIHVSKPTIQWDFVSVMLSACNINCSKTCNNFLNNV